MAPYTNIPLSPAELSYLHTSLSQTPPIRPDGRTPTQFRPLVAEADVLPTANGSARVCLADGTEAVVGVKAEVEKTRDARSYATVVDGAVDVEMTSTRDENTDGEGGTEGKGEDSWLELAIEIPGMRDDDALPVFLSTMLAEALLADGGLKHRLWINRRFHWRLYIDILLLSQPLSYPLPLLSLTTHLAMLATRMPALVSERDEDPLFNDDWEASQYLYPRSAHDQTSSSRPQRPPVTLLVISVRDNIFFDPSKEELAVADAVLAISVAAQHATDSDRQPKQPLKMIALRTIDPPSRLTGAGVPNSLDTTSGGPALSHAEALALREKDQGRTVWRPPRGGVKRAMVARMISMATEANGVGQEVLDGLVGVET